MAYTERNLIDLWAKSGESSLRVYAESHLGKVGPHGWSHGWVRANVPATHTGYHQSASRIEQGLPDFPTDEANRAAGEAAEYAHHGVDPAKLGKLPYNVGWNVHSAAVQAGYSNEHRSAVQQRNQTNAVIHRELQRTDLDDETRKHHEAQIRLNDINNRADAQITQESDNEVAARRANVQEARKQPDKESHAKRMRRLARDRA